LEVIARDRERLRWRRRKISSRRSSRPFYRERRGVSVFSMPATVEIRRQYQSRWEHESLRSKASRLERIGVSTWRSTVSSVVANDGSRRGGLAGHALSSMQATRRRRCLHCFGIFFDAVSIYAASWAELMAWSDGLRMLGCGPLAVPLLFYLFVSFPFLYF
jgi:hypothetical protein